MWEKNWARSLHFSFGRYQFVNPVIRPLSKSNDIWWKYYDELSLERIGNFLWEISWISASQTGGWTTSNLEKDFVGYPCQFLVVELWNSNPRCSSTFEFKRYFMRIARRIKFVRNWKLPFRDIMNISQSNWRTDFVQREVGPKTIIFWPYEII